MYKIQADFEAKEMHDWNSVNLYANKALNAVSGKKIIPEQISKWKIPTNKKAELIKSFENLMIVYDEAIELSPYHLAVAVSSLDCWAEQQEENWQTWDINSCKNNYLNAMHQIYNLIQKNEKNYNEIKKENKSKENVSVTVITEDKHSNLLQIIYFDFDKSNLSEVSTNKIKNFIKNNRKFIKKYLIVGHTDTLGTKEYNLNLSLERAEAVKKILIQSNIDEKNIKILGKGENKLLVETNDEVRHPANRRAEISPLN